MIKMAEVLSVRIDEDLKERLSYLMDRRKIVDRSAYLRRLIDRALTEDLLDYLAEKVESKRISVWKAASIAEIPLRAMMTELAKRDIPTYDEQAFREDLRFLEGH
jgi:predicted HTH domain antitoxin